MHYVTYTIASFFYKVREQHGHVYLVGMVFCDNYNVKNKYIFYSCPKGPYNKIIFVDIGEGVGSAHKLVSVTQSKNFV